MRMLSDVRLVNNISSVGMTPHLSFLRRGKLMEPEGKYFTGTVGLGVQAFLYVLLTVSSLCTLQMQQRKSLPGIVLQQLCETKTALQTHM